MSGDLASARREAEEYLHLWDRGAYAQSDGIRILRSLLAFLPDEGETPALTGLEAALVGDRPAPQPSPTLADAATSGQWRGAALRVGEDLSSTGPLKYYDFGPGEWMAWALDAIARLKARALRAEVERLRKALGYITDISEANAGRAIVEMKRIAHEALDSAPAEEEGRDE